MNEAPILAPPFHAIVHETLPSTNDEAKALAVAGAAHGTIVWAKQQISGRGRLDRSWVSPPGNLYMSAILRPDVSAACVAEIGFAAAVAVADCVASFLPDIPVTLKWPNDVLADGGKIAGILIESQSAPSGEIEWLVLGIGINVATAPGDTPYEASSLHGLGASSTVMVVLQALAASLADALALWRQDGFEPVRQRWLARGHGIGQPIELRQGGQIVAGRFHDLDTDGALVLDTVTGRRRITTGDVHFTPSFPERNQAL